MIKRILAIVLASTLVCACASVVFATGDDLEILLVDNFKQGDVNLDTKVNIKDATLIQKHLAKIKELDASQLLLADVDGKEGVSIKDATHLQKWIAGLVDQLFSSEVESSTADITTKAEKTEAVFTTESQVATEETDLTNPTEITKPAATLATDPDETTEALPSTATAPAETSEVITESTTTTRDSNKPIELPFVPNR